MKRNRIEESIYRAVNSSPAIPFEELASAPFIIMSEHDYITKQEKRSHNTSIRQFALAAALCLVLFVPVTGWFYQNKVTDSVITMDVNPSIKITTNRKDHVLSVIALNEDAVEIIGDSDYKGMELDDVVANLVDTMVEQSYLSTDKNTILLTIMNKNNKKADELLTTMDINIREHLKARSITPTILKQIISKQTDRSGLAGEYHISEGKMKLIQEILAQNDSFTLDMLVGMSMEQLYRLAKENALDLSGYLNYEDTQDADAEEYQENNAEDASDNSIEDNSDEDSQKNEDSNSDQEKSDYNKSEDSLENDDQSDDSEDQNEDSEDQNEDNEDQNEDNEDQNQDNEGQNEDNEDQNQDNEGQSQDNEDWNEGSKDQNQDSETQNDDSEDQNQDSEAQNDDSDDNIGEGDQGSSLEDQEESGFEDSEEDSQIDENSQDSTLEENNDSEDNNNQDEGNSSSEGDQESNSASEDE